MKKRKSNGMTEPLAFALVSHVLCRDNVVESPLRWLKAMTTQHSKKLIIQSKLFPNLTRNIKGLPVNPHLV